MAPGAAASNVSERSHEPGAEAGSAGAEPGAAEHVPLGFAAPPLEDAPAPEPDDDDDDFDFERALEEELTGMSEDDIEELVQTFAGDTGDSSAAQGAGPDVETPGAEPEAGEAMLQKINEEASAAGLLGEGPLEDESMEGERAPNQVEPPPPPPPVKTIHERHNVTGPDAKGYWYQDGAALVRILRRAPAPKNALSVRCFQHRNCSWLLPLRIDPGDEAVFEWLLEVAPTPPFTARDRGQEITREHMTRAHRFRSGAAAQPATIEGSSTSSSSGLKPPAN